MTCDKTPFKVANPGNPCCDPCLIQSTDLTSDKDLTDHFTLADAENFSYHEAPFEAIQVSEAGQLAIASTAHPQSPYPPRVQIEFYGDQIGSQARVVLGGKIVAQVTVGDNCSELDILLESDDSELTPTLTMPYIDRNEWHRLTVCFDPDTGVVKATVTDLTDGFVYNLDATYTGTALTAYAAFGTGPTSADNVYFRNFRFWRLWYCGDAPYTSDCHIEGDDWDYYYELPERKYCFTCLPSCTVVDEDFSEYPDGDMPCDWDAGATDWAVASGAASGNGEVCHKFDTTSGYYSVTAEFDLGQLATAGDSVTVALKIGTTTISLEVLRSPGTTYKLTWTPVEFGTDDVFVQPTTVALTICVASLYNDITGEWLDVTGPIVGVPCVSITQPTLAGHVDSALTNLTITKTSTMDANCPTCCPTECEYCETGTWTSSSAVEIAGLASSGPSNPCGCTAYNGTYYLHGCGTNCRHSYYGDAVCSPGTDLGAGYVQYSVSQEVHMYLQYGPTSDVGLHPLSMLAAATLYVIVEFVIDEIFAPVAPNTQWYRLRSHIYFGRILNSGSDCKEELADYVVSPLVVPGIPFPYCTWNTYATSLDGTHWSSFSSGGSPHCNALVTPATATVTLL